MLSFFFLGWPDDLGGTASLEAIVVKLGSVAEGGRYRSSIGGNVESVTAGACPLGGVSLSAESPGIASVVLLCRGLLGSSARRDCSELDCCRWDC
jgi:putative cofactor-binding repeat protein